MNALSACLCESFWWLAQSSTCRSKVIKKYQQTSSDDIMVSYRDTESSLDNINDFKKSDSSKSNYGDPNLRPLRTALFIFLWHE